MATKNKAMSIIPMVEVFRAGKYGEAVYTDDDINRLAAVYNPSIHEAPINIDHEDKGPAFGWIKKLTAKAGRLFADIEVSPELKDALESRRFKKRSIEILNDASEAGISVPGNMYIQALAFLGAKTPRVKGMADIFSSQKSPASIHSGNPKRVIFADGDRQMPKLEELMAAVEGLNESVSMVGSMLKEWAKETAEEVTEDEMADGDQDEPKPDEMAMDKEDKPKEDAMSDRSTADVKRLSDENKAMQKRLMAIETERINERANATFDQHFADVLKEGKVTPGEKEPLRSVYMSIPHQSTAKFGDKQKTARQAFLDGLKERAPVVEFGSMGEGGKRTDMVDNKADSGAIFSDKDYETVDKYMSDNKVDRSTAIYACVQRGLIGGK